jgi:hypothetical protein
VEVGRRQTDRPRLEFWRGADQFGGRIMTRLSLLAYCTLTRGRYLAGDIRIDSTSELTRGRLIWRGGIDDSTHVASMRTHPLMLADREPRPASINHQHYLRSMVVLLHQPPKANQASSCQCLQFIHGLCMVVAELASHDVRSPIQVNDICRALATSLYYY